MKRTLARTLRRIARKLDPQGFDEVVPPGAFRKTATPQIHVTYNGVPADAVVTAPRNHIRRNGLGGLT